MRKARADWIVTLTRVPEAAWSALRGTTALTKKNRYEDPGETQGQSYRFILLLDEGRVEARPDLHQQPRSA
jgi:hypothetical protein